MDGRERIAVKAESVNAYGVITERILALLESGTVPWHQPWATTNGDCRPRNLVSRTPYRGINAFLLPAMGYASPYWLTFRQAQELGGHVRKGEKACPVVFWKWLDVVDEQTGEKKRIPFLRYYSAFNAAQCDGIATPALEQTTRQHTPIEAAQAIVEAMPKRPEIMHGSNRAAYSPALDRVAMPDAGRFESAESYYDVLFHELAHSTGHESRLNRKGAFGSDGAWSEFGSQSYSKEELVAEMSAAFLCGHAGIVERVIDNSAAYIAGWLTRLRDDSKLVVQAAAQAQKAADFILNRTFESEAVHA